jgi:hypothetical protein
VRVTRAPTAEEDLEHPLSIDTVKRQKFTPTERIEIGDRDSWLYQCTGAAGCIHRSA